MKPPELDPCTATVLVEPDGERLAFSFVHGDRIRDGAAAAFVLPVVGDQRLSEVEPCSVICLQHELHGTGAGRNQKALVFDDKVLVHLEYGVLVEVLIDLADDICAHNRSIRGNRRGGVVPVVVVDRDLDARLNRIRLGERCLEEG